MAILQVFDPSVLRDASGFHGFAVATTLQEGVLHFATESLESLRASGVSQLDIVLAVSQSQYLRARLALPEGSDTVTVYIE